MSARYTTRELEEFRVLIGDRLVAARARYTATMVEAKELADHANDNFKPEEGGDATAKEELLLAAERQKQAIVDLEAAQTRVANGTYGVCANTNALIPKERLRAVPTATFNINQKPHEW